MENMFSMKNTEKLTHTIIKTKEGKKEPQAVGILLVDDIGVVATCYDNPVAFATLLIVILEVVPFFVTARILAVEPAATALTVSAVLE